MVAFTIMELGSPSSGKGNPGLADQNQSAKPEGQGSDFLLTLLANLLNKAHPISAESLGESIDLKGPTKDSKESQEDKTASTSNLPSQETIEAQIFPSISLLLGKPDQQGNPVKGDGGDAKKNRDKKNDNSPDLSLLKFVTPANQILITPVNETVLKESPGQELITADLTGGPLFNEGGEGALNRSQSPKNGIFLKGTSGEEKPGLMEPAKEDITAAQFLKDGTEVKARESGDERQTLINFLDPGSAKDGVKKDGTGHEFGNTRTSRDTHAPSVIGVEKGADSGNENTNGLESLSQGDSPTNAAGPLLFKVRDDPKIDFDQKSSKDKNSIQNPGSLMKDGAGHPQRSEITSVLGNTLSPEKIPTNKQPSLEHPQRTLEMVLPQDQTFTVKNHSPSSMEVSLEPEGLGKLNIELKLTDHHINAQIMVNDSSGKALIENNLPQLLSELGKEGIHVGQFSVSLNNQGREQNPTPIIQPEPRGQPTTVLGVGGSPSITDNHLVHIII